MEEESYSITEKHWYAVHTKSQHEKLVYQLISQKGIEAYLPIRKLLKKWSDRKKIIAFPLFKGYLFVHIPLAEKNQVLHNKGVVRILGNPYPEPVPEEQIQTLKCFENHEVSLDPYPMLKPGKYVKVVSGPLQGCQGYLVKKKSTYRLVVSLKVLSRAVSVEMDASDVSATE